MTPYRLCLALFFTLPLAGLGQLKIIADTAYPQFQWELALVDLPFMMDAARAETHRRTATEAFSSVTLQAQDFGHFYRNLSMCQTTEMTRNIHGSSYYGNNILWNKLIRPSDTKRYILNRLGANITALGVDYLLTKVPYGYAFQHEEFHRAVLSVRGIYSYDEVWKFQKGFDIAVTGVKDEDLIFLKKEHQADLVRLHAAGVEGEYAYFLRMREDNFFNSTAYPMLGLTVLGTLHAVNYVNLPFADRFNDITDSILSHDQENILARDFTGYDFSAWVYDLFTPDEPYEARGTWPGGQGIKRPIKESDLTPEMKSFLKETGKMQYLNFITPFMVGINKLQVGQATYFNFAMRSVPTSFGYYAGGDFFLEKGNKKMLISLGANRSATLILPSFGVKFYDLQISRDARFLLTVHGNFWLQPDEQMYFSESSKAGVALAIQPNYRLNRYLQLFADVEYKTAGWLFANPYLDQNLGLRLGLKINTL